MLARHFIHRAHGHQYSCQDVPQLDVFL